jgi:ketosteroid isomerase-like protein
VGETNAKLARRVIDAFNAHDLDGVLALSAEDIVVESRLSQLEGAYHGHEGSRRWWSDLLGTFGDYGIAVDEIRTVGEGTIAYARAGATGATSSVPLVDPFWIAMLWQDGKLAWWRVFPTEEEAEAGLAARS